MTRLRSLELRRAALLVAIVCLGAYGTASRASEDEPPARSSDELFEESERLAARKKYKESLEVLRDAFVLRLPEYRGREFKQPVEVGTMSERELRGFLLENLESEYPDEELEKEELVLKRFGFVGPDFDYEKTVVDLMTEEVAGFYDTATKKLYVIGEDAAAEEESEPPFWKKLFGGGGFDFDEQRSVLAHELAHALADQHFDIHSLLMSAREDDDAALAISALVEGEAMVVMQLDMLEARGGELPDALRSMEISGALTQALVGIAAGFAGGKSFRRAPLLWRETLLFPYTRGRAFCGALTRSGDWSAVDAAFREPPLSTEQVLHPEKWGASERDEPKAIAFEKPFPLGADTWELVDENVLGELTVEILLRPHLGKRTSAAAAEGWDGDLYRVYRRRLPCEAEVSRILLVWVSNWDDAGEARELADALWKWSASREGFTDRGRLAIAGLEIDDGRLFTCGEGISATWREGEDVWLLDRAPEGDLDALIEWSRAVRREAKRLKVEKAPSKVSFPEE